MVSFGTQDILIPVFYPASIISWSGSFPSWVPVLFSAFPCLGEAGGLACESGGPGECITLWLCLLVLVLALHFLAALNTPLFWLPANGSTTRANCLLQLHCPGLCIPKPSILPVHGLRHMKTRSVASCQMLLPLILMLCSNQALANPGGILTPHSGCWWLKKHAQLFWELCLIIALN